MNSNSNTQLRHVRQVYIDRMNAVVDRYNEESEHSIELLIYNQDQFGAGNEIGIHLYRPTESDLYDAIDTAERDSFDAIVVYI